MHRRGTERAWGGPLQRCCPGCPCGEGGDVLAMGFAVVGAEDSTTALNLSKHILLGRKCLVPGEFSPVRLRVVEVLAGFLGNLDKRRIT